MNHRDIYRPGDRVRVHPMGYPSVLRGAEGVVARVLWDGAGIVIRLPDGSERLVDYSYILPVAAGEARQAPAAAGMDGDVQETD